MASSIADFQASQSSELKTKVRLTVGPTAFEVGHLCQKHDGFSEEKLWPSKQVNFDLSQSQSGASKESELIKEDELAFYMTFLSKVLEYKQ